MHVTATMSQGLVGAVVVSGCKDSDASGADELLKQHLRYEFALQLNNSEAIAGAVAQYVALRRTPETINRYYDEYAKLTPADIRKAAQKYLIEKNRTVVTLTSKASADKAGAK